jgi:hypothetical protein
MFDPEKIQNLAHCLIDYVIQGLGKMVESGYRGENNSSYLGDAFHVA